MNISFFLLVHADLIVIAIESLEGVETEDKLLQFAAAHQLDAAMVVALADSLATLIWELAKASSTVAAVSGLLNSIFPPEISTVISKVFYAYIHLFMISLIFVYPKPHVNRFPVGLYCSVIVSIRSVSPP